MAEVEKTPKKPVAKPAVAPDVKPAAKPVAKGFLCALLVRGLVGVRYDMRDTLISLRLHRKHACVVLEDTRVNRGMLVKAKDYITYGLITAETKKELESKRGLKDKDGKLKLFYRLHPPRGGFERKGIKKYFTEGGVLGNRGGKMNDLIIRML